MHALSIVPRAPYEKQNPRYFASIVLGILSRPSPSDPILSNSAPRRIRPVAPLHRGSVEVYDGDDEMTAKDRLEVRDAGRSFFVSESSLEMRAHQPGAAFSML